MKKRRTGNQMTKTSKFISLILRHKPETIGISIDEHGWADVQGLIRKSRLYAHLSTDMATAKKVGSRHGRPVIYEIDCKKMAEDGYQFFLSANQIWLTKEVPPKYLCKVTQL